MNTAIIALGNRLMGDDGAGSAALEWVRREGIPADVTVVDAGTPGFRLLHILAVVDVAVLIDAVDFGGAPGEIRSFTPADVAAAASVPVSRHEGNALHMVAVAERLGQCPRQVAICAIQPARIGPVQALTAPVAAGLPALAKEVVRTLRTMVRDSDVA